MTDTDDTPTLDDATLAEIRAGLHDWCCENDYRGVSCNNCHDFLALMAALAAERARVERVRALADEWTARAVARGDIGPDTAAHAAADLRAALDAPEDPTRTARTEER